MSVLYKGWIPTVAGRLSFRSIGLTSLDNQSIFRNEVFLDGGKRKRYVVAYQRRQLSDAPIVLLANKLFGQSGDFLFVLIGHTTLDKPPHENSFVGDIRIFIRGSWKESKKRLNELIRNREPDETYESFYPKFDACEKLVDRSADCKVSFSLDRNGFVTLSDLQINHLTLPKNGDEVQHAIVNHCYFYLRDICHIHQHHAPRSDRLLTVLGEEAGQDKDKWKRHVLYSLLYQIIHAKRKSNTAAQARVRGIIAYTQTFEKLAALPGSHLFLPELTSSASAKEAELNSVQQTSISARGLAYSIFISVIAVLVAATNLVAIQLATKSDLKLSPQAIQITRILVENINIFFWLALLGCVLAIWVGLKGKILKTELAKETARVAIVATPNVLLLRFRWFVLNPYLFLGPLFFVVSFLLLRRFFHWPINF